MFKFFENVKIRKSRVGESRKANDIYALRHITADNHAKSENIRHHCFHQSTN